MSALPTGTKERLAGIIGEARASMIERLDAIFSRSTPGPWKPYRDGVHPENVGGMGSGKDYAICCFGPDGYENGFWIASIHNDWPMIIEVFRELADRTNTPRESP